ncbi:Protoporphyrinogen oxidase [Lojkania enalia]|uniref:Protoporphyrinogen oxidase n=1 Tax=Lojkania enalia TaxID=147567 RepID=A0A9P4N900_9PLEO|nr:Protoporphyrinogen oxidase [Didymosphaeria enalia]
MRLRSHVPLLESSLKYISPRPLLWSQCNHRRYASSTAYPEQIAILGGGISGLASAYFVNKEFPNSKITIYESQGELGGWIRSRRVEVPGGDVLFEYGPRTLRPAVSAKPTAGLIQDLGLIPEAIYTPKDAPAARNRYIYYPDRMNRLPTSGSPSLFTDTIQGLMSGLLSGVWGVFREPFTPKRESSLDDCDVGYFITRHVDVRIARNVVSAVAHGIYAGNIWQLSAKTLFPVLWELESRYGSVIGGLFQLNNQGQGDKFVVPIRPSDWDALNLMRHEIHIDESFYRSLKKASTFSFRNGLQTLPKRLAETLRDNEQVEIKTATSVIDLRPLNRDGSNQITVFTKRSTNQPPRPSTDYIYSYPDQFPNRNQDYPTATKKSFDLVISTLPCKGLTEYVTVQVVNLWYSTPNLQRYNGFGYLIPESVPFEQNPERALGVIFDSDAIQGQDSVSGTKLTVMLGGHWWNGWEGYPDENEGTAMAKSVLRRHLGITEEPKACHVTTNYNCIPQYRVGYNDRVSHWAPRLTDEFNGRVKVVGTQFDGVGVNDCILGAWRLAKGLGGNGWKKESCGLDRFADDRPWRTEPVRGLNAW